MADRRLRYDLRQRGVRPRLFWGAGGAHLRLEGLCRWRAPATRLSRVGIQLGVLADFVRGPH
jgi:hypothetical protein